MNGKRLRKAASVAVLFGVLSLGCAAIAIAATSSVRIVPVTRTAKSAVSLAKTMMANPKQLVGAQFVIAPPQNGPNAIGSGSAGALAGFPIKGGRFAILTDGCSKRAAHTKFKGASGCNDRGPEFNGTRDTTILRLEVRVPKGASCLSFRFRFLSNEYPTWVGSDYSDAFIAEQGYYARWRSHSTSPHLYNPDDFAMTPQGLPITINKAGVAAMKSGYARGTGYRGATQLLRASTRVKPGKRFILLSIFDQGDRQFDSAVFIDHLTIDHRAPCTSGVSKYQ